MSAIIKADPGYFFIVGIDASLRLSFFPVSSGSFTISGSEVILRNSAEPYNPFAVCEIFNPADPFEENNVDPFVDCEEYTIEDPYTDCDSCEVAVTLSDSGLLYGTGINTYYQLGLGVNTPNEVKTFGAADTDLIFKKVVSGRQGAYTLAITTDGDLWACGGNSYGALGDNPVTNAFFEALTQIPGKWKDIAVSHYYNTSIGIKTDGTLWGTGYNAFGQLGLGHQNDVYAWTQLSSNTDWNIVECTHFGSFAVTTGGVLYYTGLTSGGCFGSGIGSQTVKTWTLNTSILVSKMSGGYDYMVVQNTEGNLYAAGYNGSGQFGVGNKTLSSSFIPIGISNPISFCAGWNGGNTDQGVTFVVKSDGSLWAAGSNGFTIMGTGDTTDKINFIDTGMTGCKKVASKERSVLMIKTDGSLYGCGRNFYGELGLGHNTSVTTFTSVSALAWNLWACTNSSLITASIEVAEEIEAFPTTDCPEFDETDPYEVSELINC